MSGIQIMLYKRIEMWYHFKTIKNALHPQEAEVSKEA